MIRAYRLPDWGQGGYQEVPVPAPGSGEVLLEIGGAGLCASDLHFLDLPAGGWDSPPPFTLGHENAGWVAARGPNANVFAEGDAVLASGIHSCGRCRYCTRGHDNLCPVAKAGRGAGADGGLAQYVLVPERELVALGDLEPHQAAPLADAAHTSYGAVAHVLDRLTPDATALIIGAGGLGSYAIQYVRLLSAARIIVADVAPARRAHALDLGADVALGSDAETVGAIKELTHGMGVDAVLDFVGSQDTVTTALQSAAVGGRVALIGMGSANVNLAWGALPALGCEVSWRIGSSLSELGEVVALARGGKLRIDTQTFGFDQIEEALRNLARGELQGRAVVIPGR